MSKGGSYLSTLFGRVGSFWKERILPVPGRVIAAVLYLLAIVPYGILYRALARETPFRPTGGTYWRPWRGSSDNLEKARRRY